MCKNTPEVILNTLGLFLITPRVLSNVPDSFLAFPRVPDSKSKFSSNNLELSKLFPIFALSFGEMDDDIEESY